MKELKIKMYIVYCYTFYRFTFFILVHVFITIISVIKHILHSSVAVVTTV